MPIKIAGLSSSSRNKSGKSRFGLSAPQPALINFDRSEDWLLGKLDLDILRDRIVLPPGEITPPVAERALKQFEQDMVQAKALAKGGACETIFIDGGSQLTDIITIQTLDESKNKNNTYKYAGRNAYIRNEAGPAAIALVCLSLRGRLESASLQRSVPVVARSESANRSTGGIGIVL